MQRPYSVIGLDTHCRQARPAAAASTPWWDRQKLGLDQPENSETERQGGAIGLLAPKIDENGADSGNPSRRRILEPKVLRRSPIKLVDRDSNHAVGPPRRPVIPSTAGPREPELGRAVTTRVAQLIPARQPSSQRRALDSDTK
jgi:hypothetical protein